MGSDGYALVVEDDPDVGALLRHHLGALGYDVVHVASAEEALERIRVGSPRLAVVDILLPGADGTTVVSALRSAPEHAACRVVVTSVLDPDDVAASADAVLTKPFGRQDVARVLRSAGATGGPA